MSGIAVFAGGIQDASQSVVDILVEQHRSAEVDVLGRGLEGYTSLNLTDNDPFDAASIGLQRAKHEHVAFLNGQDLVVSKYDYGVR